jgi:preprotein translocase subunit SecA
LEIKLPFDENRGKECYLRDIVYGDTLHFIGDALRDIGRDMRHGRAFEFLIIDEVDSSLIDSTKMKVQLSDSIPGFEYLNQILVQVRGTAISIARFMQQEGEKCRFELPENQNVPVEIAKIAESYKSVNSVGNTPPSKLLDKDCGTELKEFIVEYSKEVLYNYMQGEKREILIPNFLMRFAHDQINNWAESLLQSFFQKEKHSYIVVDPIEGSRYPFKVIAPIDYENTGVIQTNLQWSNGLHQFLEIKHSLTLVPENVISIFMSYAAFFAKYKGSIFGVTGTLGNEHHHKFFKRSV